MKYTTSVILNLIQDLSSFHTNTNTQRHLVFLSCSPSLRASFGSPAKYIVALSRGLGGAVLILSSSRRHGSGLPIQRVPIVGMSRKSHQTCHLELDSASFSSPGSRNDAMSRRSSILCLSVGVISTYRRYFSLRKKCKGFLPMVEMTSVCRPRGGGDLLYSSLFTNGIYSNSQILYWSLAISTSSDQ